MRTAWLAMAMLAAPAGAASAESLPEALAAAYERNPAIQAARAASRAADENIAQAQAAYLPRVDVQGSYATRRTESLLADLSTRVETTLEPSSVGVQLSQSVFTGFRRNGLMRQARAGSDAAADGLRETEQGVLLQAIAAYVDVRRDEEVVRIRSNGVEVLSRQLQAARDRFEVGEITRTDVAQAEARLAAAEATLAAAAADLAATRAGYLEVIGRPPEGLSAPPAPPALPASLDEASAEAERLNPALQRFRAAERAVRAQVRIEASELLPQVSVVGRLDRQDDFSFDGSETDVASATAQVTMPLFEGGFSWSAVRQARLNAQRAAQETELTRRAVLSDVTSAWNDHIAALRVVDSSRQQVRATALAFEGAQEELKVGLRTTLDVLNAQQEALEAELAVVRAERDAYVAAHGLLAAIGSLTPQALSLNVSLYDPAEHRRAVRWKIIGSDPIEP